MSANVLGVLISGAVGAGHPKLAGIYLQVSYFTLSFVLVVVFVAWNATAFVWTWWGADPHLAHMAGYFSRVLSWSLPAQLAYSQLAQFFAAQRIMQPEVTASLCGLLANLALGLTFVIPVLVPLPGYAGYGFAACPIVTATVTYLQFLIMYLVYCHGQKLHQAGWAGWSWRDIMAARRIQTYLHLYVPAALSLASDFWRVAVIGAMAAQLGTDKAAIFNTSYRIMWIVMILINALASASGIKTTLRLGQMDVAGARRATWVGIYLSAGILAVLGVLVLYHIRVLGRIFTNDPILLNLFEDATVPFTITLVLMNLSVALERVPYSMGRTKEVFWYGFIASWGFQVPGVIVMTNYWRDDLVGLYSGMAIGYFVLAVLYGSIVVGSDWDKHALEARRRSEMPALEV
jgi:multidrug resistance protein, MATE family